MTDLVLANSRASDRDLGNRLQRPHRWVDAGDSGRASPELALEARGRADDQEARRLGALIRERVRHAAEREGDFARPGDAYLVADLECELSFKQVERLVEGVRVQRRPRSSRRHRALDQRDPPVGFFAAEKNAGGAFVELEATLSAGAPEQGVGDTVGLFESSEVARIGQ